jgi:hypothetical protein
MAKTADLILDVGNISDFAAMDRRDHDGGHVHKPKSRRRAP